MNITDNSSCDECAGLECQKEDHSKGNNTLHHAFQSDVSWERQ